MKLEKGKKYRARDNKIVTIIKINHLKEFPYLGDNDCSYFQDGSYTNGWNSPFDLIEEIKEENTITVSVGKSYLNKNGEQVVIILKDSKPNSKFPFISDKGHTYTENGRYYFNEISEHDLVGDYKPVNLKLGRKYVCQNGNVVLIVKEIEEGCSYFIGNNSVAYKKDGSLCLKSPINFESGNEIVKSL